MNEEEPPGGAKPMYPNPFDRTLTENQRTSSVGHVD